MDKSMCSQKKGTNQDLFANLPSEIIIDILSRLPVRSIVCCKCVRKSWLELVKSHLSKGVPALAIYQNGSNLYEILDFEDGLDIEHHELHYNPVIKLNFPYRAWINGSASGLLFMCRRTTNPHSLYICNPFTHDYIDLHCPQEFVSHGLDGVTYGFGVSKITGQHKVVRIFQNYVSDERHSLMRIPKSECECHVYTIGTGSWRRVAPVASLVYDRHMTGAFLNGNLHWLVSGLNDSQLWVSCFDLETELFSTFSPPPPLLRNHRMEKSLLALGDCLCLCDNASLDEIVIWSMKEYGLEQSWTKEFVINKNPIVFDAFADENDNGVVYPLKVFEGGDVLMTLEHSILFYYSKKNKTTQKIGMFKPHTDFNAYLHTPCHPSLQSFELENVRSF